VESEERAATESAPNDHRAGLPDPGL